MDDLSGLNFDVLHAQEWVIEERPMIAGMRCPGGYMQPRSHLTAEEWAAEAESDLRRVAAQGFRCVYSLIESDDQRYAALCSVVQKLRDEQVLVEHWHGEGVEIGDFGLLSVDELVRRTRFISEQIERLSCPVVVHCSAGCGRTSYMLAALALVRRAPAADDTVGDLVNWAYSAARGNAYRGAEGNQYNSLLSFARHIHPGLA